jgi:hypothetical protein
MPYIENAKRKEEKGRMIEERTGTDDNREKMKRNICHRNNSNVYIFRTLGRYNVTDE